MLELGTGKVGNGFSMLCVGGNGRTLRRQREEKRERERFPIIISLIALYGSLNALGSCFLILVLSASNYWAGAVTLQEEIILGQLEVYRREPAFLTTFMESVKLKVTGVKS